MNIHKNARLTPIGRERIARQIEGGQTPKAVAGTAGVCPRTVRKWVAHFKAEGRAGLIDRSSRPKRVWRYTRVSSRDGTSLRSTSACSTPS
jgi:transposase-like protein